MVSKELRRYFKESAAKCNMKAIDFMGELADYMNEH
jgi:hypothetical protein